MGLFTAAMWVVYIQAVGAERALAAAGADLAILLSGSVGVQLWSKQQSFRLFVAFDVGAALGTYLLVTFGVR